MSKELGRLGKRQPDLVVTDPIVGSGGSEVKGTAKTGEVKAEPPSMKAQITSQWCLTYGGPQTVTQPKPVPKGVHEITERIQELIDVAVRYAEFGRPRLADDRLRQAQQAFAVLGGEVGWQPPPAGFVAMWKSGNLPADENQAMLELHQALLEAVTDIEAAKQVNPVHDSTGKAPKIKVIVGSSCNPPTGRSDAPDGHAGIVAWSGKDLRIDLANDEMPHQSFERLQADGVVVLPVYKHMFDSKSDLLDFPHRLEMAKLAFESIPGLEGKVEVSDMERTVREAALAKAKADALEQGIPVEEALKQVRIGTVDIVRELMKSEPDTQFVLALGADTAKDLREGKWKEGDVLQQMLPIVVIPRVGVDGVDGTEENAPKLSDISSTQVRKALARGAPEDFAFLEQVLDPKVLSYILTNQLYGTGTK